MERAEISLKEDCSFEILPLLDDDEYPHIKILNPKDKNEFAVKETNDAVSSNSICQRASYDASTANEFNGISSSNYSIIDVESVETAISMHSAEGKEIENIDDPVLISNHDKKMPLHRSKFSESNNVISLNSESMNEYVPKEKLELIPSQLTDILVKSSDYFNCSQVEKQYASREILNCKSKDSIQEEDSPCVSKNRQGDEIKSGVTICEVVEDNETPESSKSKKCNRKICQLMDNSLQFCSWIQGRKCVQRFAQIVETSFKSIASSVEHEINEIIGSEHPLRISIISDELSARAIEDAFTEVFRGHMLQSVISVDLDTIPTLPIGYSAGVQGAQMKINYVRKYNLVPDTTVIVCTSTFLYQAVPQRWQMTTAICLDDPNLSLNFHNFTATTPIPDQYVMEAERQTLPKYHLRDYGLAVDIKQAICTVSKRTLQDPQEFLTGVSQYSTLKSAALILAGMYKKYVVK